MSKQNIHFKRRLEKQLYGTNDVDVIKLDKARHAKQHPNSKLMADKYKKLEVSMSQRVLNSYSIIKHTITSWEEDFVSTNCRFPSKEDILHNSTLYTAFEHKKLADEILKSWNISVHK